jgi:hypothetical protein
VTQCVEGGQEGRSVDRVRESAQGEAGGAGPSPSTGV